MTNHNAIRLHQMERVYRLYQRLNELDRRRRKLVRAADRLASDAGIEPADAEEVLAECVQEVQAC